MSRLFGRYVHEEPAVREALCETTAHRCRGIQSALLSVRLADAAASCDTAVLTTQPGSRSRRAASGGPVLNLAADGDHSDRVLIVIDG
ncbi:hypothetical protein ACIBHX_47310 [Nonomuraea sp. NPDC050536]|uniref:hypothetical protein n=1 Tax=Nonomuraea sp. NPDC050536 TaxID=3364366 RepID=UPI0037C6AFB8